MSQSETIVRECLCKSLQRPASQAGELDLSESLAYGYGFTSLDLIMLITSVCSAAGVELTEFTEDDVAQLQTPSDLVNLLAARMPA